MTATHTSTMTSTATAGEVMQVEDVGRARTGIALEAIGLIEETDTTVLQAGVERLFSPRFRATGSGRDFYPHHAARGLQPADYRAFSDRSVEVLRIEESGNRVIVHAVFRGTHVGTFQGRAGTGEQMRADGLFVCRIVGGLIEEAWSVLRWQ